MGIGFIAVSELIKVSKEETDPESPCEVYGLHPKLKWILGHRVHAYRLALFTFGCATGAPGNFNESERSSFLWDPIRLPRSEAHLPTLNLLSRSLK